MRKWFFLGVLLFAVGVGVVFMEPTGILLGRLRGEPFFADRPLSAWRKALLSQEPQEQVATQSAFVEGGSGGVPILVTLLSEDTSTEWAAVQLRCKAAELLGDLGTNAADAAPALVTALDDEDLHVRATAAVALGALSRPPDEALPKLTALVAAQDGSSAKAARTLSKYGPAASSAVPVLLGTLTSKNDEVRWNSARTLGKIGPDARAAIKPLIAAMKDENPKVREHAAESLGQIGPEAHEAVPGLIDLLRDPAARVRRDSARSLGQIGLPAGRQAIPALYDLADDSDKQVRDAVATALRRLEPPAK